jgi:light-regulated signal transduction histidine kinase (bacteriophytochrome)
LAVFGSGPYIVRKFTGLFGGQVSVESEFGCGSTFIVNLPIDAIEQRAATRASNLRGADAPDISTPPM